MIEWYPLLAKDMLINCSTRDLEFCQYKVRDTTILVL